MTRSGATPRRLAARSTSRSRPRGARIISLTHTLHEAIPVWPGDPYPSLERTASYKAEGYFLQRITLGEHTGTHLVAPRAYYEGGMAADEIPPRMCVLPALVLDKSRAAARRPDYLLTPHDLQAWESRNGTVDPGTLVLLNTGWGARWDEPERFLNTDAEDRMHFPGFSREAAEMLAGSRRVAGLGIDTHGIDGGLDTSLAASRALLAHPCLALENLTNLGRLPPRGALIFIGALPIAGGSGAPAQVLALIP